MRLSKIYRSQSDRLERLQLLSFDTPEGMAVQPGYRSPHAFQTVAPVTDNCGTVDGSLAEAMPEPLNEAPPVAAAPQPAEKMADVEAIREEARQQGYQDGLQAGEERLDQTSRALSTALTEVQRLRESLLANSRDDMLNLVMAISEQVIQQELALKPDGVLPVIERALRSAVRSDSVRVRVHPDDLAAVTEYKPLFLANVSGLSNIAFDADPSLSPGGCRIESELGEVDATLETQLEEIRSALADAMGER